MTKPSSWYARRYVEKFGMAVIPLKPSSKLPVMNDWGNNTFTNPGAAEQYWAEHADQNIGFALGPSGLCSLDIDCMVSFRLVAEEFGIELDAELAKVPTVQGADKGMRCIFAMPFDDQGLQYHKLNWPREDDPSKHYTVFEIRVAEGEKQRFDVLPPSVHPDTLKPYKWIVQPPSSRADWPEPPAWLLAMLRAWDKFKPQLQGACPWAVKSETAERNTAAPRAKNSESAIDAFNDAHDIEATLTQYGYTRKGKGRYLSPHSATGLPGVKILPDGRRCFIHHASDPLCSDDTGHPVNPFDLYCYYDHGGDASKAAKAAAQMLGLARKRPEPRPAPEAHEPATGETARKKHAGPFRFLGYNGSAYYYLPRGTEQVAEIKRGSHTSPSDMLSLAPIEWWEMQHPKEKGGTDWYAAASHCMRESERRGIYSHDRERGRGAWYDKGRAVLHLGNHLLVDCVPTAIADHESKFIYTKQAPLEHGADSLPAADNVADEVFKLFEGLRWSKPVHAQLMAGWCFLSPICGALSWRPHIWLTAQRGAGKSWVQDHIVNPLLGPAAMMVQGGTSEAGIRQKLRQDARPIVFDEAESEDQKSQNRMQSVIELARQSSSDSTAEIVKGTVQGNGMSFRMRSMFMLGSVNVSLSQAADESRFSVLSLRSPDKSPEEVERFAVFSKQVDNLLSDDVCASIRARAYRMMPVIRANAKTFARAVAEALGSQRIGDQMGTLIAGAYGLRSAQEISLDDARSWVSKIDFSDAKEAESASDEESCLQRIMQSQIRFDSERGSMLRSVGEVVAAATGETPMGGLFQADANDVLKRYGLMVEGNFLVVANKHAELEKLLQGTPWAAGWKRILSRIDGASVKFEPVRFAGTKSRAVKIPLDFLK